MVPKMEALKTQPESNESLGKIKNFKIKSQSKRRAYLQKANSSEDF